MRHKNFPVLRPALRPLCTLLLGLVASAAHTAGFQLIEQNVSGLGNAYAGSAAIAENIGQYESSANIIGVQLSRRF